MILHLPPGSPEWARDAAVVVLVTHIGGGAVGLISGAGALAFRKGSTPHRIAGNLFFAAMLVMSGIGAVVAPFLPQPQWTSTVAGVLTFYLVWTGWAAARRPDGPIGRPEALAVLAPIVAIGAGLYFILKAGQSADNTVDGAPAQAFYVSVLIGTICAASDIIVIVRRRIAGRARIARHLWRMCFGLFIASVSFFLGQPQVMPAFLRHSPLLFVPALAPLAFLAFWMLRVWFSRAFKPAPLAEAHAAGGGGT